MLRSYIVFNWVVPKAIVVLIILVNGFRADHHIPPVHHHKPLDRIALHKVIKIQQCGEVTHFPCGEFGPTVCRWTGEVLAWGYDTPSEAEVGWENSPEHRKILLGRNYVLVGGWMTPTKRWGKVWILEFGRNCI